MLSAPSCLCSTCDLFCECGPEVVPFWLRFPISTTDPQEFQQQLWVSKMSKVMETRRILHGSPFLSVLVTLAVSFHLVGPHCPSLQQGRALPPAGASGRICAQESPPVTAGLGGGYFSVSTMCSVQACSCTLEVQWVAFLGARSEVGPSGSMCWRYELHGPARNTSGCGALCLLPR